ncbi:recombinase family protein [Streptosporangium sp. NPDC020072]|uniref:recombinase family protein n=1 Tax=Streptosporangium sp. NPDC020072 TaxID=3154788 RepID=UPI00343E29CA
MARVLPVKRISRDTETSSALERQGAALLAEIQSGGHVIAGWVEDATVSGAVNLVDRKSLGKWMKAPLLREWEVLMVTEQDRITRDDMHWWEFVTWLMKNNKSVIVLDDPSLDLTTIEGRMIAGIKASQAAKYRESVKKKRSGQVDYFREVDLWPGGIWPYGYRSQRIEFNGRKRWRLVLDPVTAPLVREAYDRLVNKKHSLGAICKDWNARGIMTPMDHQRHTNALLEREYAKTEVKGSRWQSSPLSTMLRKPSLMGYAVHKGKVRMRDGEPVQWAEGVLTPSEFQALQRVLNARGENSSKETQGRTDLVGVVFCKCTRRLSSGGTRKQTKAGLTHYDYYLCSSRSRQEECEHVVSWPKAFLKSYIESSYLHAVGDMEITVKTFIPGVDYQSEINIEREAIENLNGNLAYMKPGSMAALNIIEKINQHSERLSELEAAPSRPDRWEENGTGETFREQWLRARDWAERGQILRDTGIRLYCGGTMKAPDFHMIYPDDLADRINDALAGTVDPAFVESFRDWSMKTVVLRTQAEAQARGPRQGNAATAEQQRVRQELLEQAAAARCERSQSATQAGR